MLPIGSSWRVGALQLRVRVLRVVFRLILAEVRVLSLASHTLCGQLFGLLWFFALIFLCFWAWRLAHVSVGVSLVSFCAGGGVLVAVEKCCRFSDRGCFDILKHRIGWSSAGRFSTGRGAGSWIRVFMEEVSVCTL